MGDAKQMEPFDGRTVVIYDANGNESGVVLCVDREHIGWSLRWSGDEDNQVLGSRIALGRAAKGTNWCLGDLYRRYSRINNAREGSNLRTDRLQSVFLTIFQLADGHEENTCT